MKMGNYTPDELRDINLHDLRLKGVPEDKISSVQKIYSFPNKIIEFLTEVRRIEEDFLHEISLFSNVPALQQRYFLVCKKPIGAGNMCKVYLFYDRHTNQYVVFKLVPLRYIRNAARLNREKEILTELNKLQSPYLVKVLGLGIADFSFLYLNPSLLHPSSPPIQIESQLPDNHAENPKVDELPCYVPCYEQEFLTTDTQNIHIFLIMPYIRGETLESYCLVSGKQYEHYKINNNLFELLSIILQAIVKIAAILDQIHGKGLVHRDIKPSNIMMQSKDHPILIDFGIAQRQDIEGVHRTHCSITHGLGNPGYRDPCTSQYDAAMKSLQEKIATIIEKKTMDFEHWKSIAKESKKICTDYPLQTQRLMKKICQYQRELFVQRWFHLKQWMNKQSITIQQWNELEILVEELQRCSHPYEDVFSLGATLYWCLTGSTFTDTTTNTSDIHKYLSSPVKVEIKFMPSLFGVDSQVNTAQRNNQLGETLTQVETSLSDLLTQMLQHPLEKRCSLRTVQQKLKKIIRMLP